MSIDSNLSKYQYLYTTSKNIIWCNNLFISDMKYQENIPCQVTAIHLNPLVECYGINKKCINQCQYNYNIECQ